MHKIFHQLPLVIFTLGMPGVILSYGLNYQNKISFLLWHMILGLVIMGTASLHLKKPTATPAALKNIRTSWFSREALSFLIFFVALLLQIIIPGFRGTVGWVLVLIPGAFGVISTILLYRKSPLAIRWPIVLDFIFEGLFLALLIQWIMPESTMIFNQFVFSQYFLFVFGLKIVKDLYLILTHYWANREKFWMIPGALAVISWILAMLNGILGSLLWVFLVAGINSILLRFRFFVLLERESLQVEEHELRKEYLPEEYQDYFPAE